MDSSKPVMVFVECAKGGVPDVSLESLNKGRELASELNRELQAVMIADRNSEIENLLRDYGVDRIYFMDHPLLSSEDTALFSAALTQVFTEKSPGIALFGATITGNDLAGRVAARLKTGLVTDCVALSLNEQGLLLQTKLTHGGRISSTFACPQTTPQMATIVPGIFAKKQQNSKKEIIGEIFKPQLEEDTTQARIISRLKADPETISLDEAEIIVSGGRGMGSRENFTLIRDLAVKLGGVAGASLGAVDDELAPRKCLVGQTGTTVIPDLYIACGISGSIYHVLGMKDSKAIVAINKDSGADIFKYSDMGLLGDAVEILRLINNRIEAERKSDD